MATITGPFCAMRENKDRNLDMSTVATAVSSLLLRCQARWGAKGKPGPLPVGMPASSN